MMKQAITTICVFLMGAMASCAQNRDIDWSSKATSIAITITEGDTGTSENPLDIKANAGPFTMDIEVRSASGSGSALSSFDGWLSVSSRPGKAMLSSATTLTVGNLVRVIGGVARGVDVQLTNAFGSTFIWVEDLGYAPHVTGTVPACSDGFDNDGDGLIDSPADPGCVDALDDSETGGSMASGVSRPIHFRNPTLAESQGKSKASSYQGEVVTVDHGDLVVTRVSRDGMYVTDFADDGGYNHMFVFNFNTPAGVRVCDRLFSLSGTIGEFYGFTEMNFPSWELNPWFESKGACPLPEPRELTAAELKSNSTMEKYEAALVRVRDVRISDFTVNCDMNGDGDVDFEDYETNTCPPECQCRDACEKDPFCTELNQYGQYGQWAVAVGPAGGEVKLWVVTRETIPAFEPLGAGHPSRISSITGTLRNMSFLRPAWILEPRCPDDLVVAGEPPPIVDTCIFPRTGAEDEPN